MKSCYSVKDLQDLEKPSVNSIGSKAYNLFRLHELGCNVPDFFVLSVNCVSSLKKCGKHSSCYRDVLTRKCELDSEYVAVRSSSLCEDGLLESWAGHFTTHLSINEEKLFDALIDCSRSQIKSEISLYQKYKNIAPDSNVEKIGIIVQKMIYPDVSGVLFTKHPVTGDTSVVYGELCSGLCEKLVSGTITPDTLLVSKDGYIIQTSSLLGEQQILELVRVALKIENSFGLYCDIEWAIENNIIWILQARPITTS